MKGQCIDDHLLVRYRELLDAEDQAFSEMEHDFEEGDAERFARDREAWLRAIHQRVSFLDACGLVSFAVVANEG